MDYLSACSSMMVNLSVTFVGLAMISSVSAVPANIATAELMLDDPMARSLDGTPAYYYIRQATPGSVNASKFVIHIQGGGWCSTIESCTKRAAGNLGSSNPKKTKEKDQEIDAIVAEVIEVLHDTNEEPEPRGKVVEGTNPVPRDWDGRDL